MGGARASLRAGGRCHVRRVAGRIRESGGGRGGLGQAAAGVQTLSWAIVVRVVMARPAAGKAWRGLVLRSRCRWRSMTMRRLPRTRRVSRWKVAVMAAGRLAVAAPERVLARAARRAAVNEISRGWSAGRRGGLCERAGLAGGGAGQGAGAFGAADPGGVLGGDQGGAGGAEDRVGGGSGAGDGRLCFFQEGLGSGPAPSVGGGELPSRVARVAVQVGDEAEHLAGVLAVYVHVIFDDADFQAPAAASAGQVAVVAAIGQEPADAGSARSGLTRIGTWVPVASIRRARSALGKLRSRKRCGRG